MVGQNSNKIEVYSIKRNVWSELGVTLQRKKGARIIGNDGLDNIIIFNGQVLDNINVLTDEYKSEKLERDKYVPGCNPCPLVTFQN